MDAVDVYKEIDHISGQRRVGMPLLPSDDRATIETLAENMPVAITATLAMLVGMRLELRHEQRTPALQSCRQRRARNTNVAIDRNFGLTTSKFNESEWRQRSGRANDTAVQRAHEERNGRGARRSRRAGPRRSCRARRARAAAATRAHSKTEHR